MSNDKVYTPTPWEFEEHSEPSQYFGNIVGYYPDLSNGMRSRRTISCQLKYGNSEENNANASLIVASVNSYAKHTLDPIAAAESGELGKLYALLDDVFERCFLWKRGDNDKTDVNSYRVRANALLAQRKVCHDNY